jgi:hypothetical protein
MWNTYHRITRKIIIDDEFPRDKLINIMKPYLHLYYTSLYATNGTYKQCNAEYTLKRKLMRFRNYNPLFGRKYIRFNKDILGKRHRRVEFDFKHINFYKTQMNNNDMFTRMQSSRRESLHNNLSNIRFSSFTSYVIQNFQTPDRIPSPSVESNDDSTFGGEWYNNEHQQHIAIFQEDNNDTDDDEEEEEKEDDLSIS